MKTVLMSLFLATRKNQNCFSGYACIALESKHAASANTPRELGETNHGGTGSQPVIAPQHHLIAVAQAGREALLYLTLQKRQCLPNGP